jgi:hypothetical protein
VRAGDGDISCRDRQQVQQQQQVGTLSLSLAPPDAAQTLYRCHHETHETAPVPTCSFDSFIFLLLVVWIDCRVLFSACCSFSLSISCCVSTQLSAALSSIHVPVHLRLSCPATTPHHYPSSPQLPQFSSLLHQQHLYSTPHTDFRTSSSTQVKPSSQENTLLYRACLPCSTDIAYAMHPLCIAFILVLLSTNDSKYMLPLLYHRSSLCLIPRLREVDMLVRCLSRAGMRGRLRVHIQRLSSHVLMAFLTFLSSLTFLTCRRLFAREAVR